jgi:phage terminase large subunit-like protein
MAARSKPTAANIALRYAEEVVCGDILACKWVKLVCERHLRDLKDAGQRGLVFNPDRAQHVVDFFFTCRHVKGELAGQRIQLEPWQVFELATVFGWEREDGFRRFTSVYEEEARKNAKSTKLGGVGLYLAGADGEPGAEVYSAGTTFTQAGIIFNIAKQMRAKSPALKREFEVWAKALVHAGSGSRFEPIHSKADSQEGHDVHGALVDEFHVHKTDALYQVLRQGKGSRRQPLIWAITTAGSNQAGPCYEMRDYTLKVLSGVLQDDSHTGFIFTIDEGDDWRNPACWIKANPNLGISVNLKEMAAELRLAMASPRVAAHFKTKRLNVWVGAMGAYFDLEEWDACARKELQLSNFAGQECLVGLDLAAERDLVAAAILFRRQLGTTHEEEVEATGTEESEPQHITVADYEYSLFVRFYLPEHAITDPNNVNRDAYRQWAEQGWITLTPGTGTDFSAVERDILQLRDQVNLLELGFDEWQAHQLSMKLIDEGIMAVKVPKTVKQFSAAMKELNKMLAHSSAPESAGSRLVHDGNPVMRWMIGNVVAKKDANDNVFPRKEFPHNKIDGPVATLMALGRAMVMNGTPTGMQDDYSLASVNL